MTTAEFAVIIETAIDTSPRGLDRLLNALDAHDLTWNSETETMKELIERLVRKLMLDGSTPTEACAEVVRCLMGER